jgi:hypothetical protein
MGLLIKTNSYKTTYLSFWGWLSQAWWTLWIDILVLDSWWSRWSSSKSKGARCRGIWISSLRSWLSSKSGTWIVRSDNKSRLSASRTRWSKRSLTRFTRNKETIFGRWHGEKLWRKMKIINEKLTERGTWLFYQRLREKGGTDLI